MASAPPHPLPGGGDAAGCCAALERATILDEAAEDPALASCCVRDLTDQARAERLKAELLAGDRVEARVRAAVVGGRATGVGPPPPAADDDDLAAIRAARLAQMRAEAGDQARRRAGGQLVDLKTGRALWRLVEGGGGENSAAAAVVAHLFIPGAPGGAALDEVLAGLAAEQGGRLACARLPVAAPGVAEGAGLPGTRVPVLAAFRGGALVAKAPVAAFMGEGGGSGGGEGDEPDAEGVAAWLRAARVLKKEKADTSGGGRSSDEEEEEDDEEGGGGADPCAQCGRTYPHEHVRSTRAGGGWGGGGGDSSSTAGLVPGTAPRGPQGCAPAAAKAATSAAEESADNVTCLLVAINGRGRRPLMDAAERSSSRPPPIPPGGVLTCLLPILVAWPALRETHDMPPRARNNDEAARQGQWRAVVTEDDHRGGGPGFEVEVGTFASAAEAAVAHDAAALVLLGPHASTNFPPHLVAHAIPRARERFAPGGVAHGVVPPPPPIAETPRMDAGLREAARLAANIARTAPGCVPNPAPAHAAGIPGRPPPQGRPAPARARGTSYAAALARVGLTLGELAWCDLGNGLHFPVKVEQPGADNLADRGRVWPGLPPLGDLAGFVFVHVYGYVENPMWVAGWMLSPFRADFLVRARTPQVFFDGSSMQDRVDAALAAAGLGRLTPEERAPAV